MSLENASPRIDFVDDLHGLSSSSASSHYVIRTHKLSFALCHLATHQGRFPPKYGGQLQSHTINFSLVLLWQIVYSIHVEIKYPVVPGMSGEVQGWGGLACRGSRFCEGDEHNCMLPLSLLSSSILPYGYCFAVKFDVFCGDNKKFTL